MREASFILPLADNQGHDLEDLHSELVLVLVLRFGGCTMTDSTGAWADKGKLYLEKGRRYTVAISETSDDVGLLEIAANYARRAAQKALYHVSQYGLVQIITINEGN